MNGKQEEMKPRALPEISPSELLEEWKRYIERAAADDKPALTTLQAFGDDPTLLLEALTYARKRGVDVMVAAESDGTFH